jgi:hypothetical protein
MYIETINSDINIRIKLYNKISLSFKARYWIFFENKISISEAMLVLNDFLDFLLIILQILFLSAS